MINNIGQQECQRSNFCKKKPSNKEISSPGSQAPRQEGPFTVIAVDQYNVKYMDRKKKKIANKDDVRLVNESSMKEEAEEA
uniref:Zgc: n=1 Tax=Caenorhabditis tropicalis TaxID=1561998 RepID=A0A1I7UHL7_9PELO